MIFTINNFALSHDLKVATKQQEKLIFTFQEQQALHLFIKSENGFVTSEQLEEEIWGERVVTSNSLRKLISGLRIKFKDKNSFKSVRGKGYQVDLVTLHKEPITLKKNKKLLKISLFIACATLVGIFIFFKNFGAKGFDQAKTLQQDMIAPHKYIFDSSVFKESLYITLSNQQKSKI